MINSVWNDRLDMGGDVLQMIRGHQWFLERNTGLTNDARKDHYVFNPEYVLSNNRHFIAASQMEAQPNGDATSEGQTLQIIGYCYSYMATHDKKHLEMAEKCWQAYVDYFYNEPLPETPRTWVCNWIINGKEPVPANGPIDWEFPTHSGFKGELLEFKNGLTQVPHGAPYWGEWLDKATFAFIGSLAWDSIVGTVKGIKPDGSTDWDEDGIQWDVEWIINWEGKKIDWDGNVEANDKWGDDPIIYPPEDYGKIQLKDTSVNGLQKTNFAYRLPVEHGGYLMPRNSAWHNRPLHVPVTKEWYGNAADAEEWMVDASYLLWKLTGKKKYWTAWQCAIETCKNYSRVDQYDRFFRQSGDNTPFTDGISYDWQYPSGSPCTYGRTADGYITIDKPLTGGSQVTLEQQAIWFKCGKNSKISVDYGGLDVKGNPLRTTIELLMSPTKSDTDVLARKYMAQLPPTTANARVVDIPVTSLVPIADVSGNRYFLADERSVYDYGNTVSSTVYDNSVLGRQAIICKATIPDGDSGYGIGFWLTDTKKIKLRSITYKASKPLKIAFIDDQGYRWYWELPAANNWYTQSLEPYYAKFNSWQDPGHDVRPVTPYVTEFEEIDISLLNEGPCLFQWYCINDIPPTFSMPISYTMTFNINFAGDEAYTALLGNCEVKDYMDDNLFCTPGVIPFSNISVPDSEQYDGWRGLPYPGYQYPFIYCHDRTYGEFSRQLENMAKFMYQSQQAYYNNYGSLGPGMSAYVWNRWDNLKYGAPDTWTMYHWGDGHAWAGYQPRAYCAAARAWYELVIQKKAVPKDLIAYVENWSKFLIQGFKDHGCNPTDWLVDGTTVYDKDDFTGHQDGLWVAGSAFAMLAGSKVEGLQWHMDKTVEYVHDHYVTLTGSFGGAPFIMNGGWCPGIRDTSKVGAANDSMFFGFWSGELLRGLGLYLLAKNLKPGQDMYHEFEPDVIEPIK